MGAEVPLVGMLVEGVVKGVPLGLGSGLGLRGLLPFYFGERRSLLRAPTWAGM